jgi:hypothetical protein
VHRDVKPSNVLLAESAAIDVRLLDFGLAQMAEFDTLTGLGDIPGTLAYISPERLHGLAATTAADVWGVGVLLWEALAGEHPFWGGDLSETSRLIQEGAPPLESLRPDLPRHVLDTVASALVSSPQRRPSAERLAQELRSLPKRRRQQNSTPTAPPRSLVAVAADRLLPGALAGLGAGWVASALPFYPANGPLALAAVAAALGLAAPRAGLLFVLGAAFFPLANISLGLAAVYAVLAVAWAVLNWRDARAGLLFAAGPLLQPLAALALVPLAAQAARGRPRRAAQAMAAVLLAAVLAGLRGARLPFDRSLPALGLGIAGSHQPGAVAHVLAAQLGAHPVIVVEALLLGLAAAVLPQIRHRGPWAAAGFGAALLAGTALVAPATAILPLVAAAWLTAAALALEAKT